MAKILKIDPIPLIGDDDTWIYKDFTGVDEAWFTFEFRFTDTPESFQYQYSGDIGTLARVTYPVGFSGGLTGFQMFDDVAPFTGDNVNWVNDFSASGYDGNFDGILPTPIPDHWFFCEAHYIKSTSVEIFIDSISVFSGNTTDTRQTTRAVLGQVFGGCVVYFRNPRVSTFRYNDNIFADDFSSGDVSNWTANSDSQPSHGVISVINDPFASPPANDNFANRTTMAGDSGSLSAQTTDYATEEVSEPTTFSQVQTVWYEWTPSVSGVALIEIDQTAGGAYIIGDIFTGSSLGSLVEVDSFFSSGSSGTDVAKAFNVVAGTSYKIQVGTDIYGFRFSLAWSIVSPPANDNFANATILTGISGSVGPVNSIAASKEVGEPSGSAYGGDPGSPYQSTWYKWVAPSNGKVIVDYSASEGSPGDFDEWVNTIWSGVSLGTLVEVESQDLYGGNRATTFTAVAGTTYYIQVATWGGAVPGNASFSWTYQYAGTISAPSTVSGAGFRHTHRPIVPTTGIAATSTVSGAIRFRRITPTTGIVATSTVFGHIVHRIRLLPTNILATSTVETFVTDIFVYVPAEVFTSPAGVGYPLLGPAAANPDGYFIDSLDHSFTRFQTYRGENLRFKQIIREVQDADWEISLSQVNAHGDPIVWRRIFDNADFILPWQNHFRIRYKEAGVETPIMAGFIKSTNGAKGRDFMKVNGVDWMGYFDRRQIPFNPLATPDQQATENFFGPSTPPTGYSYQVAGRDIFRIVHDILEFVLSKPRSLPLDISDPGTTFMGVVINYALALGDTSTALNLITGLSEYWPGFDFLIGYNRNFEVWTPARFGDPDDTANSGPDGDNIAYAFGDDFNHPVMDVEYTNNGVQATHLLGTGAGSTANRVAKAIGAGDIQRQFWRLDDSIDFGDQAKTQAIVAARTRREFIFKHRELHEIELTIDPSTVEDFHNVIKVGYAIWLRDDLQFHEIDSAQKVVSIEMTVDNEGDRTAVLGLNQIYDTSNMYGVNEA